MMEAIPRTTLTVVAPIKPDRFEDLKSVLAGIDQDVRKKRKCPLPELQQWIHTMRWVILPYAVRESGTEFDQSLVLWAVFDGSLADRLRDLTENPGARSRLDQVYDHCEGYPTRGGAKDVKEYLDGHAANGAAACFDGVVGRTLSQIHDEDDLRVKLKAFLDTGDWTGCPQSHIYLVAKAWLKETQPAFEWALEPAPMPKTPSLRRYGWIAAAAALAILIAFGAAALLVVEIVLGLFVVVFGVWVYLLHRDELRAERSFVAPERRWFEDHDGAIGKLDNEDSGLNRITILTDLHPGFVRCVTMRVVLWIVNLRARLTTDGKLQGVETIHFAQWRLLDGGRRLVFMSNYDGRADDYFRDFSENAAPGVNAIWSNTVGFPPTTLLIGNGSRDLPRFQRAARSYQIHTDVWYFGYRKRSFTTKLINDNTRIREGLRGYLTPPEVKEWLELVYADAP